MDVGVILGRDTVPGDGVMEVDGARDMAVVAGEGKPASSAFRRRGCDCDSVVSLPAGLRILCMPSDRDDFWLAGDSAGPALVDGRAYSPILAVPALVLSESGGNVLDSRGGKVLYLSSFLGLDNGRDADGPCDMWTSSLGRGALRTP